MTDISKLKAEAEEARENLIRCIHVYIDIAEKNAEYVADTLMAAVAKKIALQAAEKEAEARKYESPKNDFINVPKACPECGRGQAASAEDMKAGLCPKYYAIMDSAASDDCAAYANKTGCYTIADDGWIKWEGGECPVNDEAQVEVRLRGQAETEVWMADKLYWGQGDHEDDIIAYRIISPAADRVSES